MAFGIDDLFYAAVVSALVSSAANYATTTTENKKTYKRQKALAGTAHQREIKDLKAAGLNPVLSAGGGGASAAYSAQSVNPGLDLSSPVMDAFGKATDSESKEAQIAAAKRQLDLQEQQQGSTINANNATAKSAENQALINKAKAEREQILTAEVKKNPLLRYQYINHELLGADETTLSRIAREFGDTFHAGKNIGQNYVTPYLSKFWDQIRDPNHFFGFEKGRGLPNSARKIRDINPSQHRKTIERWKESNKVERPIQSRYYQHVKERYYD